MSLQPCWSLWLPISSEYKRAVPYAYTEFFKPLVLHTVACQSSAYTAQGITLARKLWSPWSDCPYAFTQKQAYTLFSPTT